jgi:hypothetical protein
MKKIISFLVIPCAILMGLFSCTDDEKDTFPDPRDGVEARGAYFRTLNTAGLIDETDLDNSNWAVTGELVSLENGADISDVEIHVTYGDNNFDLTMPETSESITTPAFLTTTNISSFVLNDNGFPEATITINLGDAVTALNLDSSVVLAGDQFNFFITINMTDGRSFTEVNTQDILGEIFFSAPMQYSDFIACTLSPPTPGTWTIVAKDSFGDGWQGGLITVNIDGIQTNYRAIASEDTFTFEITGADEKMSFTYSPGAGSNAFEDENSYTITDPNGTVIFTEGPTPRAGSLFCFLP